MAGPIYLDRFRERKSGEEPTDLNSLLQKATLIFKERSVSFQGKISLIGERELKKLFESKINEIILQEKLIESSIFLCGLYVSNLLNKFTTSKPESWWPSDYSFSEDPAVLQQGGDICFIICAVFPGRSKARLMGIPHYQQAGAFLYYRYYCFTKEEIGYYMSLRFKTMTKVTQSCLKIL